jgi:putative DNA primase/helicase
LEGVDLLILDNLSTLMATGSEGASNVWLPIQNWLLRLRRKGVAVLIVHHAGVNGRQRGTSRREDALDTVIALRRPDDYLPQQGARFEIHIEKA